MAFEQSAYTEDIQVDGSRDQRGRIILALLCLAGFSACAQMQIDSDFDPQADFTRHQTFAFLPGSSSS